MPARGVSGVTMTQFFAAVLRGLGAPVTANNLSKLAAVARQEGHGGDYNPFNYILGPGTNFNSVGVKNYPDVQTGIAQTVRLLSQKNTSNMRANLMDDGAYQGWLGATSRFYNSWGGGSISISQNTAQAFLDHVVDGPPVPTSALSALRTGSTPTAAAQGPSSGGVDLIATSRWMDENKAKFDKYLASQPPERQAQIKNELLSNHANGLAAWGEYLPNAPQAVKDYVSYIAKLPADQQQMQLNQLTMQPYSPPAGAGGAAGDPGAAPVDPAASKQLTDLLQTFGVSYPNAPQPTPALLAFLNGLGLNMSTAEQLKNRAIERIGASTTDAMADIDRTAGRTKQNITADLVRRGVIQSGEANTRYARQEEDVAASKSDVSRAGATANEAANVSYENARDLARQQALDRVINAETDQKSQEAQSKAQTEALKAQQNAADVAWQRQQEAQNNAIAREEDLMRQYGAQGVAVNG